MTRIKITFILLLSLMVLCTFSTAIAEDSPQRVRISTTSGDIVLELDAARAPKSVENFMTYVKDGFFDGTIFHRVISNFMIQGGGFTKDYKKKSTRAPIKNEANNGLKNVRGSIAMARTGDPHSATAQFFINVVDNHFLDHRSQTSRGWGYAVFGKVIEGMDVVDKIRNEKTGSGGMFSKDVPTNTVEIKKMSVETAQ